MKHIYYFVLLVSVHNVLPAATGTKTSEPDTSSTSIQELIRVLDDLVNTVQQHRVIFRETVTLTPAEQSSPKPIQYITLPFHPSNDLIDVEVIGLDDSLGTIFVNILIERKCNSVTLSIESPDRQRRVIIYLSQENFTNTYGEISQETTLRELLEHNKFDETALSQLAQYNKQEYYQIMHTEHGNGTHNYIKIEQQKK